MSPQPWLASYGAIPAHIDPDSHPSIVHLLCAAYLQNVMRVRKGDRIAVMCPNLMAFPIGMLGIARAGCAQVNVNPL